MYDGENGFSIEKIFSECPEKPALPQDRCGELPAQAVAGRI
jgi:hypothetical protein